MADYNNLTSIIAKHNAPAEDGSFDAGKYASYSYAADNHNYGNGNFAFTDPTTWGDGIGNAGKFVVAAAVSGVNSFYNTGVAVGNWLGADLEENDTAAQLASIDSDLGKYYQENKEYADLAGFALTSMVPGLGGVKLLNAGQKALSVASKTGLVGSNLSRATGLLVPKVDLFRSLAAADMAQSAATYSALTGNTLKAIKAGYGQAALESFAFETAVLATSFKSPVLEDADGWDLAKNVLIGTGIGGLIGGAITHAGTYGAIKGKVRDFNPAEKLFSDTSDLTGLSASQRIIARQDRLTSMPAPPTAAEIAEGTFAPAKNIVKDLPANEAAGSSEQLASKLTRMHSETTTGLKTGVRSDFQTLASGDTELGNQLADFHASMSGNQSFASMFNLENTSRIGNKLPQEAELLKHAKAMEAAEAKGIPLTGDEAKAPYKVGYIKLRGEGAGDVSFEAPKMLNLADTLPNKEAVLAKVKGFGFKENKPFSAIETPDHTTLEARYIWAERNATYKEGMAIHEHDIPLLEGAVANNIENVKILTAAGDYEINSAGDLAKSVMVSKDEVYQRLLGAQKAGVGITTEEIAKIANVKVSYIEGAISNNQFDDMFARQAERSAYGKYMEANKLPNMQQTLDDFSLAPSHAKAAYNTKAIEVDGYELAGMAAIKAQQKMYQSVVDNVIAKQLPEELFGQLWSPTEDVLRTANRFGSGPGIVSFANGGYHTAASWAESVGSATSRIQSHFKKATTDALEAPLYKMLSKPEAAIEFETINAKVMQTGELYGINQAGTAIEPLALIDYKAAIARGETGLKVPQLQAGAVESIPITNPEALAVWKARVDLTGNRTTAFQEIQNAQGITNTKDPRALRPIRQDPKEFPHFAVVADETVTSAGHKSMIHAASAQELDAMIAKVPKEYKVYKKEEMKAYFKSVGEYDPELAIHENYVNSELKRRGVNNPFFVRTDPKLIAESVLKDHLRSDDLFSRELVNAKFEKEFRFFKQQGEQFTSSATSRYTGNIEAIENTIDNPYTNYTKTALNISQVNEHPWIASTNQGLDAIVTKGWRNVTSLWEAAKSPADLAATSAALEKFGVKHSYRDAATELLANHTAPRGVLTQFVGTANSILSTLVTRLDPLNALNNAVGSTVLYGTEVKSFLRSMEGDSEVAGALAGLLKTAAPLTENITADGVAALAKSGLPKQEMMTHGKLMLNAIKNFHNRDAVTATGKSLKQYYQENGWSTRLVDQYHSLMEDLTLVGAESPSLMKSKLDSAFKTAKVLTEKGEKITGNKLAEEFNRFVAADTMRQLTDIGITAGRITEQEAKGYINTFVNRTQGNILASQRPLMFQGPIGQAVGLFQTFQFNTMQQLFRHVAEGGKKDAAMLLGLQGTMYGMNGLPAFNVINNHILGTMSGNPEHKDAHSTVYGVAGKSVGDLLLYGLPSNLIRANLYTRGDINPRQLTIIPTNPADIPFVNATARMYTNVKDMTSRMANGGSMWQSLLQGIEHNGLSRPLAGLAQTAQAVGNAGNVFSTSSKGNISGANELASWATAVRLAGGKPFDEAIANDNAFRVTAYQAVDRLKMDSLAKAIKTTTIGTGRPDGDEVAVFAERYASIGGKQKNFNKYLMLQIRNSNTAKANMIMEDLKHPYSQKMQQIMGGDDIMDGTEF